MNSSSAEALFQKLARFADNNKKANCYWVQILAKASFNELWRGDINGKEYGHSRVYKISGDKFYELLSGEEDALFRLYKALPIAINDYMKSLNHKDLEIKSTVLSEIIISSDDAKRTIIDQIANDNFGFYNGFNEL